MAIFTPALKPVVYTGELPRKLWEVQARQVPVLKKGDVVILPELTAVLLVKKRGFALYEGELAITQSLELEAFTHEEVSEAQKGENANAEVIIPKEEKGLYTLPKIEQLDELTRDELVEALKFVGVTAGNKKIDTLKELLLPYIPKQDK